MIGLDIFNERYISGTPTTGLVHSSDINYLRRLYRSNSDEIQAYYLSRLFTVKNTHILSRLVTHFPTYQQYDAFRYLEFAADRTRYLAKHFKFTSDIEKGIVHPGYFYGNGGECILMANEDLFDVRMTEKNWRTEPCIKVLTHNRNDLKMLLPIGKDDGSRGGLESVSVNVPKLALKYREFVLEQTRNQMNDGVVLNKNHFVIKHVLPTMLEDTVDHCFVNKLMDRYYGREEVLPNFKHRFKIFEPTTQIERHIGNTLDVISSKRLDFVNILRNIFLVYSDDASKLLGLPMAGLTRQSKWAVIVSRLDYMLFLFEVSNNKDMNRHYLNDWSRLAKRSLREHDFVTMFSEQYGKEVKEKMYKLSQL